MADSQILYMPVESGLKFMTIIGSDGMNAKRKFFNYIINKINSIFLRMALIDL